MKQTEIGLIPEDWELKELKDITLIQTNGFVGVAKTHYTESYTGVTYIQGFNVEENSFNFTGIKKVTIDFHQAHLRSSLIHKDLLTVQTGDVGLTTYVPKHLEGSNCHALIISRFNLKSVEPKFVSFYLNSNLGRSRLKEIETGTTMKHINVGDFQFFQIPLPPLAEQEAIAKALSDADAWIEKLEQLIAKKRLIKQGAMQTLLTPKKDWEVKKLGEVLYSNPDYGINAAAVEYDDNLPTYLRITDIDDNGKFIKENISSVNSVDSYKYYLNKNELVFARTGASVGKCYLYKECDGKLVFAGFLIRIKVNPELASSSFIFYNTQTIKYWNWINANSMRSGQPGINSNELKSFKIAFPSLSEQERIATILSDMDAEIEELEQQLGKARQIKQGMMQELLTGRTRLV